MELTEEIKDLLKAHSMACVTDFVSEDEVDYYLEELELNKDEITRISKKYDGNGMNSLEDIIINKLKEEI